MLVRRDPPKVVAMEALADRIASVASEVTVATHRLLTLIREFDAEEGWSLQGALSCAQWLSWRIGLDLGAAREKVRVARALGGLPLIDDAFQRAQVSYSKVRALTRVATAATERQLLEIATQATAAQTEKLCRKYRGVLNADRPPISAVTCATASSPSARPMTGWSASPSSSFRKRRPC